MEKVPMTPEGYKQLVDELKYLKSVARPEAIRAIEEARAHGDLSENAEYDIAKEHQQQLSRQIEAVERKLALAQVIDPSKLDHERVVFGATVTLHDIDSDEKVTYQIVGTHESDIASGKISIDSPIARALIGKESGDEAKVKTPNGLRTFEILEVSYR